MAPGGHEFPGWIILPHPSRRPTLRSPVAVRADTAARGMVGSRGRAGTWQEEWTMRSPFPGMDPYIESGDLWPDFHSHLIERIADHLAGASPERYRVRTGERSYSVLVVEEGKVSCPFLP